MQISFCPNLADGEDEETDLDTSSDDGIGMYFECQMLCFVMYLWG